MPTLLWSVRAALLDTLTNAATSVGADVFDGPRRSGDTPKLFLAVGADNDDPFATPEEVDDALAGAVVQEWSPEGPGTFRAERGSVFCSAVAWSGDADFAELRAQVETLTGAIEQALLDDRQLGGAVGAGVELAEIRVWERRNTEGTAVGAVLAITYQSLLT